jgi:cytochrome c553
MQAYRSGDRSHRLMQKLVTELDDGVLQKMGVFYAVQPPARTGATGEGNADLGRSLAENCSDCHGADGNASGANMPTLAGQDARFSPRPYWPTRKASASTKRCSKRWTG